MTTKRAAVMPARFIAQALAALRPTLALRQTHALDSAPLRKRHLRDG